MRMSRLLGGAVAVSLLTPIAPANASLSTGFLMYTDLFLWPNWREILGKYDCTTELEFYLWNAPSPRAPVIITPPPVFDPVVIGPSKTTVVPPDPIWTPGGDAPHGPPTGPGNPIWSPGTPGLPSGDPPGVMAAVPEPSTWSMLLLGFAGLGYAGFRRRKGQKYLMTAGRLPN